MPSKPRSAADMLAGLVAFVMLLLLSTAGIMGGGLLAGFWARVARDFFRFGFAWGA